MRFAMTSRVSHSLLVAALAFRVLPSYGTAQAPRRPQQPETPYRAGLRPLNDGRCGHRRREGPRRARARLVRAGRGAAPAGGGAGPVERGGAGTGTAAA